MAHSTAGHAAIVELQNDGFQSGMAAGFQAGFVAGEIGAVRLDPPPGTVQVIEVKLLFGGSNAQQNITLKIWNDDGATNPGVMVFEGDYTLMGSDSALSSIDLSGDGIYVAGPFRVGIEFQHNGVPSIARDNDGSIRASHNFIMAQGFGWVNSNLLGLTGDWVIRASIDDGSTLTPDAGVPTSDAGPDGPDAAPGGPDAGPDGQSCQVHSECPTGQYCAEDDTCTYDCRVDFDCGNDMRCTSLGMCEALPSTDCSCRVGARNTSTSGVLAWMLALGLLVWTRRRRRIS